MVARSRTAGDDVIAVAAAEFVELLIEDG